MIDEQGRRVLPPARPHCVDCKRTSDVHAVGEGGALIWLCGSCEYKREHPEAERARPLPRERRALPLQGERLFEPDELDGKSWDEWFREL